MTEQRPLYTATNQNQILDLTDFNNQYIKHNLHVTIIPGDSATNPSGALSIQHVNQDGTLGVVLATITTKGEPEINIDYALENRQSVVSLYKLVNTLIVTYSEFFDLIQQTDYLTRLNDIKETLQDLQEFSDLNDNYPSFYIKTDQDIEAVMAPPNGDVPIPVMLFDQTGLVVLDQSVFANSTTY